MLPADNFEYDVFISYRQSEPDKSWVRKTLYPALIESGITVFIDYKNFRLGYPVITEMERGVLTSRYTIVIATALYFKSTFTEFENLISQHLGLEKAQQRLIVVAHENCEMPLRLRYKLWLPMITPDEFEENFQQLSTALLNPLSE